MSSCHFNTGITVRTAKNEEIGGGGSVETANGGNKKNFTN
jgi:hypothetical protein